MSLRSSLAGPARYLDAIAEFWLGWSHEPVARAVAESNWRPDSPDAYCPRCGDSVGPGEASASGCGTCRSRPRSPVDRMVRLGTYTDQLRRWVLQVKYHQRWAEMGLAMGNWLGQALQEGGLVPPGQTLIVPMPMPWQRRMYRGIDHARTIASGVAQCVNAPLVPILSRSNGPPQVLLSATERQRSGTRGLRLRRQVNGISLKGLNLVLVDDVRTTGASLNGAARLLKTLRPQAIIAAVVAVSDSRARRRNRAGEDPTRVDPGAPDAGRRPAAAPAD